MDKTYIIRVYFNDDFVGYVKNYRIYRNKKYRFNKTKNINKAYNFNLYICESACDKLNNLRDDIYTKSYNFKCGEVTDQELRRSKLSVLKNITIREGIFKNKII